MCSSDLAMLTRLGAHDSVMAWEERRMRREVRATANRLANFDDANMRRSARAAVAAGDDRAVIDAFGDVLTGDPANTEALLARGRAYAHTDQLALAESDLRELVRLKGEDKEGWESLAWVLGRQGNDAEAEDALDHVLKLDPENAKALRDRANARFRTGDSAGAREDADRACKLGLADGCTLSERLSGMR